jgi:hypothetical protein
MSFQIVTGQTRLTIENTTDNYPYFLVNKNRNYVDNASSINGCVIQISGNGINDFVGGGHGNSRLLGSSLVIDGVRIEPVTNGSYTGTHAILGRTANYASGVILEHVLHLRDGKYDDNYTVYSINSGIYLTNFYACLSSRANRLTEYFLYGMGGQVLASGIVNADSDAQTSLTAGVYSARQRDMTSGDYIDTFWRFDSMNADWRAFVWDRAPDNKLYTRAVGYEGFAGNKKMAWSQSIRFSP